jgi:hypothetical protein
LGLGFWGGSFGVWFFFSFFFLSLSLLPLPPLAPVFVSSSFPFRLFGFFAADAPPPSPRSLSFVLCAASWMKESPPPPAPRPAPRAPRAINKQAKCLIEQ